MNVNGKLPPSVYSQLFREAQRAVRRQAEAEDLFQTIWLAAIETGRKDLSCAANRRWFIGALRRRALFDARTAARRRSREQGTSLMNGRDGESAEVPVRFVEQLPAKLRTTALLILAGHSKREILWLLRTNEPALRRRIADIRRRWQAEGDGSLEEVSTLTGSLDFGRIRRALLPLARRPSLVLASHDPDGQLFVVSTSRKFDPRQLRSASNQRTE